MFEHLENAVKQLNTALSSIDNAIAELNAIKKQNISTDDANIIDGLIECIEKGLYSAAIDEIIYFHYIKTH